LLEFGEPGVFAGLPCFDGVERIVGEFVLATIGDAEPSGLFGVAVEPGGEVGVSERFYVGVACGRWLRFLG
jgi:hypothetical protein